MKRKQIFAVAVGGNGCGKTTWMLKFAAAYFKSYPHKRGLFGVADDGEKKLRPFKIVTKNQLKTFTGVKRFFIENEDDFETLANAYKPVLNEKTGQFECNNFDGLLMLDDIGVVMSRRPEPFLNLLRKRRQPNMDILIVFHGFRKDVPPSLFTFANVIVIFKTSDDPEPTIKNMSPKLKERFMAAYNRVQDHPDPHYHEEVIINTLDI